MKIKTMNDLLADQLKDLYNAENQLLKTLPKMAAKASDPSLKEELEKQMQDALNQKEKLQQACALMNIKPTGKKCLAMEGLLYEVQQIIDHITDPDVLDAGLIATSQKAEHYEIASYGTIAVFAKQLGKEDVLKVLLENRDEDQQTDELFSGIARKDINKRTVHG